MPKQFAQRNNNPKRDGRLRKLEVKTDVKKVTLRHRNGYFDPRPVDVLASSREERSLMSAMASPTIATQLPVSFRVGYFYDSPLLARIPLSAKIRADTLELKKKGGQLGTDLNVMGVAYGEITVFQHASVIPCRFFSIRRRRKPFEGKA